MDVKFTRILSVRLPRPLFDMYSKLCVDKDITLTEGIVRYLRFLHAQDHRTRKGKLLNANSDSNFKLDETYND